MVNWASLGAGKQFARHYHEDMQEIFIIVQGEAEITVGDESATLCRGDAVVIDAARFTRCAIRQRNRWNIWRLASPAKPAEKR